MTSGSYKRSTAYMRFMRYEEMREIYARRKGGLSNEDELTGALFEPLALLAPKTQAMFWHELVLEQVTPSNAFSELPKCCEMQLWPSQSVEQHHMTPPDLIIRLEYNEKVYRTLVVQLAWEQELPVSVLRKQWVTCFSEEQRINPLHIFIGNSLKASAIQADSDSWAVINANAGLESRVLAYSWPKVIQTLQNKLIRRKGHEHLELWLNHLRVELSKYDCLL